MRATALLLALAATLLGGCVRGSYSRTTVNVPIDDAATARLAPGADLQACLDALGAPIRVWETGGGGIALAWGWKNERGWGVSASYSFNQFARVSFAYDDELRKMDGVVLRFDDRWTLVEVSRGLLGDLVPGLRRPADVSGEPAG